MIDTVISKSDGSLLQAEVQWKEGIDDVYHDLRIGILWDGEKKRYHIQKFTPTPDKKDTKLYDLFLTKPEMEQLLDSIRMVDKLVQDNS